jgi:hypothetical protein
MATTKRTTFEGQPSGTVATAANTGGGNAGSGDALALVTTGSGATTTFDNTHAAHGRNGLRIATGVTSALASFQHTIPPSDIAYCSTYCYLTSYNAGLSSSNAVRFRGAGTQAARLRLTATGFVGVSDTTTANNQAMTGTPAPLNAWFRVDVSIRVSTGAAQAWLYAAHPDAPPGLGLHDDSLSVTGQLYGANPIDEISAGQVAAAANVPDTWWDDFAVSDYALPGPDPGPQIDPTRLPTWTLIDLGARWARTWTSAAAVQAGSGSSTIEQHPTTAATGTKGATGPGTPTARPHTLTGGLKAVTGPAASSARATTSATGRKGASAAGTVAQHSTTADLGAKGGIGAGAALAHPATVDTGRKGGTGAATAPAHPATAGTATKGATGTGTAAQHSTTLAPRAQVGGVGQASARAATAATGTKATTGTGRAIAHPNIATAGAKAATGSGRAIAHPATLSPIPSAPVATPILVGIDAAAQIGTLDQAVTAGTMAGRLDAAGTLDSNIRTGTLDSAVAGRGSPA